MFYGKYFGRAVFQGRGPQGIGDIFCGGGYGRGAWKVSTPEANPAAGMSRTERHGYGKAGMEPVSLIRNGLYKGVLVSFHCRVLSIS
jgi:hypothetical protein